MDPNTQISYPFVTREMLAFKHASSFSLILNIIARATDGIEIRGMTKEGPFTFLFSPVGDGSIETFTFAVPDIPIFVSVTPSPDAAIATDAYVTLHLAVNGNRMMKLCQGIITFLSSVSWPYQLNEQN